VKFNAWGARGEVKNERASFPGSEMPQSLKDKSAAVMAAGGLEELTKMIAELPDLLQRNREILDEADRMLREEKESDNQVPGFDVMITIFCDFSQFSAKELAFFSKTNGKIKFVHNLALF
jgi:hypothetical protein